VIESFNKAAERLFRCAPADVVGRNVSLLMPEPYSSRHDDHMRAYLETGRAKIIGIGREVVAMRLDGTTFPAELAVSEVRLADRRLFTGIVRDISERKRLERQILEIGDREKRRISQDLHDSLGQLLTGVGFKSKSLQNKMAAKGLPEAEGARQVAELVTQAIHEARGLARGLQPVEPRPAGLMAALEQLADSLHAMFDVECTFRCDPPVDVNDPAVATNLYRIAQEACHNAIKHGRAKHVAIELSRAADGALRLTVEDDGSGFREGAAAAAAAAAAAGQGLGLQIMRYRAAMIGGSFSIARRRDGARGTVVTCESQRVP
jgi:two-component system, LuxR family, sensor kinase FixL